MKKNKIFRENEDKVQSDEKYEEKFEEIQMRDKKNENLKKIEETEYINDICNLFKIRFKRREKKKDYQVKSEES